MRKKDYKEHNVSGLRTKFFPKSRIGQGVVAIAPWIDVVLLVIFFLLITHRHILQPGFVVDLPEAQFEQGARFGLVAFVMSVDDLDGDKDKEIIFFDAERFVVGDAGQTEILKRKFVNCVTEESDAVLTVQSDESVSHGTIVSLIELARQAGFVKVNVGTRSF
jgi:biopolymer transport protein ExbD